MKSFFLPIILLCLLSWGSQAQTYDISFFEGTGGELKKEMDKNMSEYRQLKKENEAWLKEQKKQYEALDDSLSKLSVDSSYLASLSEDSLQILKEIQKEEYLYTDSLYTLQEIANWDQVKKETKKTAIKTSKDYLSSNQHLKKYSTLNNDLLAYHKEYKIFKDSLKSQEDLQDYEKDYLKEKKQKELAKKYSQTVEDYVAKEFQQSNQLSLPIDSPEMQRLQEMNDLAKAAATPEEALANNAAPAENFFGDKMGALTGAVEQTDKLKEKYSEVIDASDLKTATKRNSMKGKSLKERIVLGGNFQLRIDQQTSVDVSPELQYLINKKWSVGVGGNYRANGDLVDLSNGIEKTQVYGYSVLTEYFLIAGFYGHLSFESSTNGKAIPNSESEKVSKWHNSLLLGVKQQFKIYGSLKGQVSMLYNFMHSTNPLNDKPWNVRVGVSSTLK